MVDKKEETISLRYVKTLKMQAKCQRWEEEQQHRRCFSLILHVSTAKDSKRKCRKEITQKPLAEK